jgi:hypothetical protein
MFTISILKEVVTIKQAIKINTVAVERSLLRRIFSMASLKKLAEP